jgi:hypothetical protein
MDTDVTKKMIKSSNFVAILLSKIKIQHAKKEITVAVNT